jgi:GR25 family glycosyltransferase involved in LPS biosynthesis
VQKEADKIDLELIRFDAIKCEIGHDGCKASHMKLLESISEDVFMVIEDDMKIIASKNIYNKAIWQLPFDYDMFYLGATLTQPIERYSENLFRLKGGSASQAIVYNNKNGVVDYILKNHNRNRFSAFLRDAVQEKFNCYIAYPMIATQASGYSDLMNKHVSGRRIKRAYKKYAKH